MGPARDHPARRLRRRPLRRARGAGRRGRARPGAAGRCERRVRPSLRRAADPPGAVRAPGRVRRRNDLPGRGRGSVLAGPDGRGAGDVRRRRGGPAPGRARVPNGSRRHEAHRDPPRAAGDAGQPRPHLAHRVLAGCPDHGGLRDPAGHLHRPARPGARRDLGLGLEHLPARRGVAASPGQRRGSPGAPGRRDRAPVLRQRPPSVLPEKAVRRGAVRAAQRGR